MEADPVKKERHVGFKDVEPEKEPEGSQGFVVRVVAGVPQKFSVESKASGLNSPETVKRRAKTGRKKVDRRVSCKDLGRGDCEGWLLRRRKKASFGGSHWDKRWCVIKDYNMFCYHDKDALKADVVIHLPAFKVSPVSESDFKTKKSAFKIHNSGTSFFFASETQADMSKWMNKMGLAAITFENKNKTANFKKPEPGTYKAHPEPDYSQSESEDESPDHPDHREHPGHGDHPGHREHPGHGDHPGHREHPGHPDHTVNRLSPHLSDLRGSQTGSTSSINSVGREKSNSGLREPSPDMRGSTEDLAVMYRRLSRKGQTIFGENLNDKRRSALTKDLEEQLTPEKIKFRKMKTLERTLQAKEKELKELEELLNNVSHKRLQDYKELHQNDSDD